MFSTFLNSDHFSWWWLLTIPVVVLAVFGLYRIITRSERFQDHKLTVCIVLSVLAHLMLLSGAYMADFFAFPDFVGDGTIQVTMDDMTDDNPVASDFDSIPTLEVAVATPTRGEATLDATVETGEAPVDFDVDESDSDDLDADLEASENALAADVATFDFASADAHQDEPSDANDTEFTIPEDTASNDPDSNESDLVQSLATDDANRIDALKSDNVASFDATHSELDSADTHETQFDSGTPSVAQTTDFDLPETDTPESDPSESDPSQSQASQFQTPEFEPPSFETSEPDFSSVTNDASTEAPPLAPSDDAAPDGQMAHSPAPEMSQADDPFSPSSAPMVEAQTPQIAQESASQFEPPHPEDSRPPNGLVPVRRVHAQPQKFNRYRLRTAADRSEQLRRRGGSSDTEAAVAAAQKWLAAHQATDGRWNADHHQAGRDMAIDGHFREGAGREADTGITGLAVLAFLGNGNTHQQGSYRTNVAKGLEFIMSQQAADGNLSGTALRYARTYCHSIATLAMSEAYAMTADEALRPFVERAVRYSLRSQHPVAGGWRYRPGQVGDMSQFGWQVMALTSADQAGIALRPEDRFLMSTFLRTVSAGRFGGLASYRPKHAPTRTMTAEGLVCRIFLDETADRHRLKEAADFVAVQPPSTGPTNLYYWYYGTMAMFQYGGDHWQAWNEALKRRLLPMQIRRGETAGSWAPDSVWGSHGGRVYSTAMAALCLEVYYRYLPLMEESRVANRAPLHP